MTKSRKNCLRLTAVVFSLAALATCPVRAQEVTAASLNPDLSPQTSSLMTCSPASTQPGANPALSADANAAFRANYARQRGVIVRPSGLMFRILQQGSGKSPTIVDSVDVNYLGMLIDCTVFDGTSPGLPANFKVTGVIRGWTEALSGMRVGDMLEVVIPAGLGYGAAGSRDGGIPPNQTLVFTMKLLNVIAPPKKGEKGYIPDPDDPDYKR